MPTSVTGLIAKATSALKMEASVLETLHGDVKSKLKRLNEIDPGLQPFLDKAHAYAVFPSVGKAGLVLGGAFGKGEVFKNGKLSGYAGLVQLTIGVQLGGETLVQIVAFENEPTFARFKQNKLAFAANASVSLVKAGAAKSARYEKGAAVFVYTEGGLMLEAAIGAQKFIFKPAALGRGKSAKGSRKPTTTAQKAAKTVKKAVKRATT